MDYYRLLMFEDISKKINPSKLSDKFSMHLSESKMVKQNILGGKPRKKTNIDFIPVSQDLSEIQGHILII